MESIITTFQSHGLIGLVVGCLFVMMFLWFRFLGDILKDHAEFLQKIMEVHAEERELWLSSYKNMGEKLDSSLSRIHCKRIVDD